MAFAGLHDENYFTILTCPACEKMATVHNRMPVILTNEVVSEWLNPDRDLPSLENHLHPYQGDDLMVEEDFTPQQKSDLRQADLFS